MDFLSPMKGCSYGTCLLSTNSVSLRCLPPTVMASQLRLPGPLYLRNFFGFFFYISAHGISLGGDLSLFIRLWLKWEPDTVGFSQHLSVLPENHKFFGQNTRACSLTYCPFAAVVPTASVQALAKQLVSLCFSTDLYLPHFSAAILLFFVVNFLFKDLAEHVGVSTTTSPLVKSGFPPATSAFAWTVRCQIHLLRDSYFFQTLSVVPSENVTVF